MFFKILLILFPLLLNSWSKASKMRFGVVLYKDVNQQGYSFLYSAETECGILPVNGCGYYYRSAERVHGKCVYLCPGPYYEIHNPSKACTKLGITGIHSRPNRNKTINDKDMKVISICDCTYGRDKEQLSEGEEDSRDLREINYYGSPKRNYYKK